MLDTVNHATASIVVGGNTGAFNLSLPLMNQIKAGTLSVGSAGDLGGITIASLLNVSGAGSPTLVGPYNLVFQNGGNYSANSQSITLGTKTLTVNAGGSVDPGTVTGAATTVSITAGSAGLTLSSNIGVTAGGTVNLATTNGGNIALGTFTVGGGTTTTLNANGAGTISSNGSSTNVSGTTVALTSGTGNITNITTNATGLTVNTSGTATVTDTSSVALGTLLRRHRIHSDGFCSLWDGNC